LIILSGCAKKNAIKQISEEEALRTRIEEFWNYRKKLELDKCYYYEYPLLSKIEYHCPGEDANGEDVRRRNRNYGKMG
jgi:hypothetical protein